MTKFDYMRLWDLYGGLLTANRQEIASMYFNLDLTVSEIADQKGISRQGVSDCLSVCKRELEGFEGKLGHGKILEENDLYVSLMATDIAVWAENFLKLHPEYAADIAQLQQILDKDYGEEIKAAEEKIGS